MLKTFGPTFLSRRNRMFPFYGAAMNPLFDFDFDFGSLPNSGSNETETELSFAIQPQGVKPENITIDVENGVMTVSGSSEETTEQSGYKSFSSSSFKNKFTLPHNALVEQIKASFDNGVLNIKVPKDPALPAPTTKALEIPVNVKSLEQKN